MNLAQIRERLAKIAPDGFMVGVFEDLAFLLAEVERLKSELFHVSHKRDTAVRNCEAWYAVMTKLHNPSCAAFAMEPCDCTEAARRIESLAAELASAKADAANNYKRWQTCVNALVEIQWATEGIADGTPDATRIGRLANEVCGIANTAAKASL